MIECSISDHDFIFTVIKHSNVNNSSHKCITTRDLKHFDIQLNNEDLIKADLDSLVENQADLDIAWHIWSEKVTNIMNKHAPLKTYRVKARNNPWMNRDILLRMYKRDYLCKNAKKTGNKALYTEYKQARNKVVNDIRKAKSDHYTSQINQSKSAKEMWKVIRSLIKIKKSAPSPRTAENFNDYFSNIGPKTRHFMGVLYFTGPYLNLFPPSN